MKMYVDVGQYMLTASFLVPSVLVGYAIFVGLAKLLARLTGSIFRLPFLGHAVCILIASAIAPLVALWVIDRPADLMNGSGKSLLVGGIAALAVVGMAEAFGGKRVGGKDAKG